MLVAAAVVNDETDHRQLVPMLEEVQANLGEVAKITVADGQYGAEQQLAEAEARGYAVLTAPGSESGGVERGEYGAEKFAYDREQDQVICPQGERLKFTGMRKKGGERAAVRTYTCQVYRQCPVRALCCGKTQGRRIEISPQRAAREHQQEKRKDPVMKAWLRQRKVIIEPAFATIKQAMGFRRWTVRGRENVSTQWALVCTAFNLKKLYQHWLQAAWVGA